MDLILNWEQADSPASRHREQCERDLSDSKPDTKVANDVV